MTRSAAIAAARAYFDRGEFVADLSRRVAFRTESQEEGRGTEMLGYLNAEMRPMLEKLGFACTVLDNPVAGGGPFLYAERIEDPQATTVLSYGHADVIRGQDTQWKDGLSPWKVTQVGERLFGRGTADNKGQHSVNLAALASVLGTRGKLGFNIKILLETGEEIGSLGLKELCERESARLKADVLIASDGPRVAPDRPTLFLGSRGALNFDITVNLRDGGHHSGNWGGLLANPAVILAHALASLTSPTGELLIPEWRPKAIPSAVRRALKDITVDGGDNAPDIDPEWGEPGLTAPEKVYGFNSFEILAMTAGNPQNPVNAIPPTASAHCQIRFTVDTDPDTFLPALERHFAAKGFPQVRAQRAKKGFLGASRTDPDSPWVQWAVDSLQETTDKRPAVLPNLGGSLPNDLFTDVLKLPTLWVPHSYAACSQHAPNEHMLAPIAREGLEMMAGLFWDLGENAPKGK
jgi:acetylornithine deacetylase/succinyl-diaminopimelate desuccinylase-like protein